MVLCKEKIKFPFKCPVCGKGEFIDLTEFEKDDGIKYFEIDKETGKKIEVDEWEARFIHCEFCGWHYDLKQVLDYNVVGDRNKKTVKELKEEYQQKIIENPDYFYDDELDYQVEPHLCPIYGEYEFEDSLSHDICPICGWEDTGFEDDPDERPSQCSMTFNERKKYFTQKRKENPKYKWKNDKNTK